MILSFENDESIRPKVLVQYAPEARPEALSVGRVEQLGDEVLRLGWAYGENLYVAPRASSMSDLLKRVDTEAGNMIHEARSVGHGLRVVELSGEDVFEALSYISHFAYDKFPAPGVRRTRLAGIDSAVMLLTRRPPFVSLLIDRSHEHYLCEVLASVQEQQLQAKDGASSLTEGSAKRMTAKREGFRWLLPPYRPVGLRGGNEAR